MTRTFLNGLYHLERKLEGGAGYSMEMHGSRGSSAQLVLGDSDKGLCVALKRFTVRSYNPICNKVLQLPSLSEYTAWTSCGGLINKRKEIISFDKEAVVTRKTIRVEACTAMSQIHL